MSERYINNTSLRISMAEKEQRKYIVTGGPGCGKTTALELLKRRGYHIVPEAARMILKENRGLAGSALQEAIMHKQVDLEAMASGQTVFLDRGLPDSEAYAKYFGDSLEGTSYAQRLSNARYQNKVFYLEPLPREHYKNDEERKESYDEAVKISDIIKSTYKAKGYQVISLSATNPYDRVNKIISAIGGLN